MTNNRMSTEAFIVSLGYNCKYYRRHGEKNSAVGIYDKGEGASRISVVFARLLQGEMATVIAGEKSTVVEGKRRGRVINQEELAKVLEMAEKLCTK